MFLEHQIRILEWFLKDHVTHKYIASAVWHECINKGTHHVPLCHDMAVAMTALTATEHLQPHNDLREREYTFIKHTLRANVTLPRKCFKRQEQYVISQICRIDWGNGLINNRWVKQILTEWHLFEKCIIRNNFRACQTRSHTRTISYWKLWKTSLKIITFIQFNTCMIPLFHSNLAVSSTAEMSTASAHIQTWRSRCNAPSLMPMTANAFGSCVFKYERARTEFESGHQEFLWGTYFFILYVYIAV